MKFVMIIERDEDGVFIIERLSISERLGQGKRTKSLIKY